MVSHKLSRIFFFGIIIAFPFFFISGPTPYSSALFRALWDCGHLLFFAGLVIVLHNRINIAGWRAFAVVSTAVFIGGGLIEIIQAHIGRDGNWLDLLRDLTGTWLGLFWLQKNNTYIGIGRILAFLLLLPNVVLVFIAALMQWQAAKDFPLLAGFEHYSELSRWKGHIELSKEQHSQGEQALKVYLNTRKYSSAIFYESLGDWRGFTLLSLDIYNPQQQPVALVLRINDVKHEFAGNAYSDRFNRNLIIEPGWNHIQIPLDAIEHAPAHRLMDMQHIATMVIYSIRLPEPKIIYIDNIILR